MLMILIWMPKQRENRTRGSLQIQTHDSVNTSTNPTLLPRSYYDPQDRKAECTLDKPALPRGRSRTQTDSQNVNPRTRFCTGAPVAPISKPHHFVVLVCFSWSLLGMLEYWRWDEIPQHVVIMFCFVFMLRHRSHCNLLIMVKGITCNVVRGYCLGEIYPFCIFYKSQAYIRTYTSILHAASIC